MGYALVQAREARSGVELRQFAFSAPTDRGKMRLYAGFTLKKGTLRLPLGNRLVNALAEQALMRIGIHRFAIELGQDFKIWNDKRYLPVPKLSRIDGPIGLFRKWAQQFYPEGASPLAALAEAAPLPARITA
jgi:hypothetical protein